MRYYAKISPAFWTSETGKALRRKGPEALLVAVYLISSPHSNMLGLYYQPILYIAHEIGSPFEGASKGLLDCVDCGFCSYDPVTEMVWVHEMASWQIDDCLSPKDKRCKGIRAALEGLPSNPFLEGFYLRYGEVFHLGPMQPERTHRPPKKASPFEAPSKPLRSQEQEQEQEKEQEQEQEQDPLRGGAREASAREAIPVDLPENAAEAASTGPPKTARGSRLSQDWVLPRPWGEWALGECPAWSPEKVRLEGEKFRDYWAAKSGADATKIDWQATWRNWCRKAIAYRGNPRQSAPTPADTAQRDAEAMRLLGFSTTFTQGKIDA